MNTVSILQIIQIIVSILLIVSILFQQRGAGTSSVFGGGGGGGGGGEYFQKRGIEKFLFRSTICLAILFFGTAIANFFV